MRNFNVERKALIALAVAAFSLASAANVSADIGVDPKGHDPVRLEQDKMECRELASSIQFNMAVTNPVTTALSSGDSSVPTEAAVKDRAVDVAFSFLL